MSYHKSKYEITHPTISFRVDQKTYDELQERRHNGQSYGDIFRIGLDKQTACDAPLLNRIEELELEVLQTEERCTVTYLCSRCGKPMQVQWDNEKEVCRKALRETGFHHRTCPP